MDTRTPQQRRRIMQSVKSRDTKAEMVVRRCLHAMGYRYRLHRKDLPGRPNIVFAGRRKAIFVHGYEQNFIKIWGISLLILASAVENGL